MVGNASRTFLDWSKPMLPHAAAWLIDGIGIEDGRVDARGFRCVLPGRRSGRLLLLLLHQECQGRGVGLVPPRVITPGGLFDELVAYTAVPATGDEMIFAWQRAIETLTPEERSGLSLDRWGDAPPAALVRELARTCARLNSELAAELKDFSDAAEKAAELDRLRESERWRALDSIAARYRNALAQGGIVDLHTAGNVAIDAGRFSQADGIVLIGVPELNAMQRALLARFGDRVSALIHAPETLHDRFDMFGCVITEKWQDGPIGLTTEHVTIVERAPEQAEVVIERMAQMNGELAADDITIGVGDASVEPALHRSLEWAGARARSAAGAPLARTPPAVLLEAAARWLEEPRFASLAELLRHPDIDRRLRRDIEESDLDRGVGQWLSILETYFSDHLHDRFSGDWLGDDKSRQRMKRIHDAITLLFKPLMSEARPLRFWCSRIGRFLTSVYDRPAALRERPRTAGALQELGDILTDLADVRRELTPSVTADDALHIVLECARQRSVPDEPDEETIELLGWLELPLDPAPVLYLTGFQDGCIPGAEVGDLFLPEQLRSRLGLPGNDARAARDACLLSAMIHSRKRMHITAARRAADDTPLSISRFYMMTSDDETLLQRAKKAIGKDTAGTTPSRRIGLPQPGSASRFSRPELPDLGSPEYMRVTDFRLYLQCPYRFALQRLLKLEARELKHPEMDGLIFGVLAHDILEEFGKDGINTSSDPARLETWLIDVLHEMARDRFGTSPHPALRVQLAHLEQRLRDFSSRQAGWRDQGWEIRHTEHEFKDDSFLDMPPGEDPMRLHGKIDRIDFNPRTGRWRIIDYKTGDNGKSPRQTHHRTKTTREPLNWIDLQLPLYHHLVRQAELCPGGDIEIGYIVLPRQSHGTRWIPARWKEEQFAHALDTAREIVRSIRAGDFDISPDVEPWVDRFPRLCHTTVWKARDDEDDEREGAAAQ